MCRYQATALELIKQSKDEYAASHAHLRQKSTNGHIVASTKFFVPMGLDLSKDKDQAAQAAAWGIQVYKLHNQHPYESIIFLELFCLSYISIILGLMFSSSDFSGIAKDGGNLSSWWSWRQIRSCR